MLHTSSASGGENSGMSFAAGRPTEAFGANTLDIPKTNVNILFSAISMICGLFQKVYPSMMFVY